ncbi:MAG: hypothetical protein HY706_13585 [Candidatus Hydrogenedentes bacterium]|nr:hypothetical protein [Candidatus Hydrogenedentota bacterium]
MSRLRTLTVGVALVLTAAVLSPQSVLACAVCFGDPESSQTQSLNLAVFTLLGIVGTVLTGVASLMIFLVRRARRYAPAESARPETPVEMPVTTQGVCS